MALPYRFGSAYSGSPKLFNTQLQADLDALGAAGAVNWLPVLQFGGTAVGMTANNSGQYVKAGSFYVFNFSLTLTAKGVSTGAATITGLPEAAGSFGGYIGILFYLNMAAITNFGGYVSANGTTLNLTNDGAVNVTAALDTNFTDTSNVLGYGIYFV